MKTNRVPATKATRLASYATDDPLTLDTDVVLFFLLDAADYEISISMEDVCGGREIRRTEKMRSTAEESIKSSSYPAFYRNFRVKELQRTETRRTEASYKYIRFKASSWNSFYATKVKDTRDDGNYAFDRRKTISLREKPSSLGCRKSVFLSQTCVLRQCTNEKPSL